MKEEKIKIVLPEGTFETTVQRYSDSDKKFLFQLYSDWQALCQTMKKIRSRTVNLPEGLSEGAFCMFMKSVRILENISGANTSFDAYDEKRKKRIQVKACSVIPDLTSFGPKSVWDEIYFLDFFREGKFDGTFDVYLLKNNDIYNHKVNEDQTLKEQQAEKRRPRFSIWKELIQPKGLKPIKTFNLKP